MVEYRAVPDESVDAFRRVLDYAFRAEAGPAPEHDDDEETSLGDRRALYDGDDIVTTAAHHSFDVAIRGRWLAVAGLSAVATRPEDRHRGLVRQLLCESLAEYRERDQAFCLLWPFKHAFYRRFGWGRLGVMGRYGFEPAILSPLGDHRLAAGAFEPLDAEAIPALRALDERFAATHDLAMRRTEAWYRHRFFEARTEDPFVYGWYRDGELGGYLRYRVDADDDTVLTVWEFGAPDHEAAVNLLRFLHRHEAQVDRVRLHARADELLFDLVEDPRAVELELAPGPMGRLVDVPAGLEALPAPTGVAGSLTLTVADPLVDWNDRPFALEVGDGAVTVAPATGRSEATLSVETLSRLALGTATAERAAAAGTIEADDAAMSLLTALFPPRDVFLREFF